MPSFASALNLTLHKALEAASSRRHEYARWSIFSSRSSTTSMRGIGDEARAASTWASSRTPWRIISTPNSGTQGRPGRRSRRRPAASASSARHPARPVLGPRRSDRRQRARRPVQRARATPSISSSSGTRAASTRSATSRTASARAAPAAPGRPRPRGAADEDKAAKQETKIPAGRERALKAVLPSISTKGQGRQGRSLIGRAAEVDTVQISAAARRTTRSMWAIPA